MNLRYRFNQLLNTISPVRRESYSWDLIYGLPRSGTTYLYHQMIQKSRFGISDWDLQFFLPALKEIGESDRTPISKTEIISFLRTRIESNAPPGAGSSIDFVIKQVNTTPDEVMLLTEIMDSAPRNIYFLYREPQSWLPSAMKKYGIDKQSASDLYVKCFENFRLIGGSPIDYHHDIEGILQELNIKPNTAFNPTTANSSYDGIEQLELLYGKFRNDQV
ncbi:MAG: hypothetical protein HN923_05870 [Euryarchaeota archaeon]|jgi:hypothetical protein|nr:hypothetical protein [Euryarchaeota archaeon]